MGLLLQDLRFSVRKMIRRPILSAIVVLSMAIGIGSITTVYGVIKGALLTPYMFPVLDRLVFIWAEMPTLQSRTEVLSGPEFMEVGELTDIIESRGAGYGISLNLDVGDGEPERIRGMGVTPSLFPTLGVPPLHGRWLMAEDTQQASNPSVLLSYRIWQSRFGGDPELVGQTIPMSEYPHTVVGIMPPGFLFGRSDVWRAMPTDQMPDYPRSQRWLWTATLLKEGITHEQADAALDVLARTLEEEYVGATPEYEDWKLVVEPLRDYFIGDVRPALFILLMAVAFVLLIVCLNVANLLLARAFTRERELALRLTLGAGRRRVIRLMVVETLVLVILGGAFGLLFSFWGLDVVSSRIPDEYVPAARLFGIDGSALAVTLAVTLVAGLLVGLFPALQTTKPNLQESLKEGGRGTAGGRRGRFVLNGLVVIEVATALALLVGLGLIVDGFEKLQDRDHGFIAENLLTFHVDLPRVRYRDPQMISGFWRRFEENLEALPGVEAAGGTTMLPLEEFINPVTAFTLEGATGDQTRVAMETVIYTNTSGFFRTMKIPLESGRFFTEHDQPETTPYVIVNQAFARRFLSDREEALGRRIRLGPEGAPFFEVAGVVRDSTQRRVTEETEPAVYISYNQVSQIPYTWMRFAVRTTGDPATMVNSVRQVLADLEPNLPLFNVRTMEEAVDTGLGGWRLCVLLLTAFAGIALLLSALGIYGVISFSVNQRTHELGIRMAMGANRGKILSMVLAQGLWLTIFGVVGGAILTYFLTQYLSTLTLEITRGQPLTYIAVTVFLLAVTLLACCIPAWRATRVSPVDALREE
ncbi:MAG: ABC transporter permease [bacterium]|nr:ABC transporter permease [bacterium]